MGMDIYGKNPIDTKGEYFRRNVWGWRPLWNYFVDNHNDLVAGVSGQTNDGDGLDSNRSILLAYRLIADLESGKAQEYINNRNAQLAELNRPACDLCGGTGIRTDKVGVESGMPDRELPTEMAMLTGRLKGFCNGCSGEGKTDNWETNYYLDLDDLKEFASFLVSCGGFRIC